MTTPFSTNEIYVRNTRIAFARTGLTNTTGREERIILATDVSGYSLFMGLSTLIEKYPDDSLEQIYPQNAKFTFDTLNARLGIGGNYFPSYAIDISATTGIRIQGGGSFVGNAKGLLSVPTAALFSTLPSYVFSPGTIPLNTLQSTGTFPSSVYGPSTIPLIALQSTGTIQASLFSGDGSQLFNIPLAAINGDITGNFFKPNSIPSLALPSTGTFWIRDISGFIAAPILSTGTLNATFISSKFISTGILHVDDAYISTLTVQGQLNISTISTGNIKAANILADGSVQAFSFIGNGYNLTSINPANFYTTIPSNKFGYHTIAFDALNPYGNFQILGGSLFTDGNATITGTTTSAYFVGDGSQLTNLPFSNVTSTIVGLATFGYISTIQSSFTQLFTSSVQVSSIEILDQQTKAPGTLVLSNNYLYLNGNLIQGGGAGTGDVTSTQLMSTTMGLGTLGYLSSAISSYTQLFTSSLQASSILLRDANSGNFGSLYIQSGILYLNGTSVASGGGGGGDVTSTNLTSTTIGLGTLGYISTASLGSTIQGLGTFRFLSSFDSISSLRISTGSITGRDAFFSTVRFETAQGFLVSSAQTSVSSVRFYDTLNSNTANDVFVRSTFLYFGGNIVAGTRVAQPQTFTF